MINNKQSGFDAESQKWIEDSLREIRKKRGIDPNSPLDLRLVHVLNADDLPTESDEDSERDEDIDGGVAV